MRYEIAGSGLSLPVAWTLCCGMNYKDEKENALERLRRISVLTLDCIQTPQDKRVLLETLEECLRILSRE